MRRRDVDVLIGRGNRESTIRAITATGSRVAFTDTLTFLPGVLPIEDLIKKIGMSTPAFPLFPMDRLPKMQVRKDRSSMNGRYHRLEAFPGGDRVSVPDTGERQHGRGAEALTPLRTPRI
jgi:hypothetical protein